MESSTNSWHARLYNWTYASEISKSLCPYFWKTLIAILWFIPSLILALPVLIMDKINKENTLEYSGRTPLGFAIWLLFIGAVTFIIGFTMMIAALFGLMAWTGLSTGIALLLCCGTFAAIVIWFINKCQDDKKKEPNIFTEFIKAKYNNYCPKITWKDEAEDKQ